MTWAEFQIRLFAWDRVQKRIDFRFREVAWAALTGFHSDPKKMPKTKNAYWQIGEDKSITKLSEEHKQAFLRANEQYLKQVADAENNR